MESLEQLAALLLVCLCWGGCQAVSECSAAGWSVPSPPPGLALKQVHAIIRHGDRTPWSGEMCWPQDNSVWDCQLTSGEIPMNSDFQYGNVLPRIFRKIYSFGDEVLRGNCSVAQLTSLGYWQHVENGKHLASAYVNGEFLSKTILPSELYLRSDDISRTLLSAESLLLGMYPPDEKATLTQPLEIHTMDPANDFMVGNPGLCPMYGNYTSHFNKSKAWSAHHNQTLALLQNIKKLTGFDLGEDGLEHYSDCLRTHFCHQLPLPQGMDQQLYDQVWGEISWQFYNMYKFPSVEENARTGIGFLLKEIWQNMNSIVAGKPKQKFLVYSGHDTTLMPILTALQVDDGQWPTYASMILMELYQNTTSKYTVRLVYNGKVLSPPFCNSGLCDFDTISKYFSTITPPDDYSKLCKLPGGRTDWQWRY